LSCGRDSRQAANLVDGNAVCDRLEILRAAMISKQTQKTLRVVAVLPSHQVDDVKSIDSPNNGQYEILGTDLLLYLLRDIISRYVHFCRMMKF
jgi:hypothetical protein